MAYHGVVRLGRGARRSSRFEGRRRAGVRHGGTGGGASKRSVTAVQQRSVGWSVGRSAGRSVPKRRRARSKFRTRELCEAWLGSRFSGGAGACSRVVLCVWSVHRTELSGGREACLKCYPKCHCKHCCGAYPPTRGASRTVIGESRNRACFLEEKRGGGKKKNKHPENKFENIFLNFLLF